ncbi:gamma-glutamyltranspeptidase / glutathione hydrolase [Methylobacterium phyllostachyos]|uniref:Gamma-glutamyltranspeptidase / glutathione hydrolase n=1 Tax=Methylobacterium phyllostachyos TaxID=582672 RepID=A0A1G9VPB8_9HYPH|nr:gamma-glutamyltransferase family protein [Methylobacterium phyllostachyos]SDM74048.1 gamma-glutamyltranspeptidase / glutathione hydrolase [Methylobacterium phyllostachyos]
MKPFDWATGYPSLRMPMFGRNCVATSHALAAQAGIQMLQAGGNAVDAAIATAAAKTLTEPCSNGLGSDAFCILWDGQQLHGLNASGGAPAAWTRDYFLKKYGPAERPPMRGWDSVTVPGAVAAWVALSERFGRLPFADLMQPAIRIAERGYLAPVVVQQKWAAAARVEAITRQPGFSEFFLPKGRAPDVGELVTFPGAEKTLRLIGETKGEAFYRGEIAAAIAAHAQANGGAMTADDLAAYKPEWVTPTAQDYRGYTLHEIPPNGQGIAAQIALGILQHFDLAGLPVDGPEAQHLQIEAMKLAFSDTYRYVADPRGMELTPEAMLDPAYLASRAKLIDRNRAQVFGPGKPPSGGTIYLTAADESGMMVSFIQSNYMGFGSGVVVPGWGISLQNRGYGFVLDPESPNVVAPGKRPFHTIIPGFLTRDGAPIMSFGVMGGNMQPQGHVQTLVRMIDHGQNPQAACDAPRWRVSDGLDINVESAMPAATVDRLKALDHRLEVIEDSYQDFGAGQFIWRMGDPGVEGYVAASDPRRDGQAVVW